MADNDKSGPETISNDELAEQMASLERKIERFNAEKSLFSDDRKRLDDAFTELRERQAGFIEEVHERVRQENQHLRRNERYRNGIAAMVIGINIALTGVYLGDATDPFGLGLRENAAETVSTQIASRAEVLTNDTLLFDDCISAIARSYPDEFTGQPFVQETQRAEFGGRLRHTITYDAPSGRVEVVCDEIFTSLGVLTTILSHTKV